MDPAELIPRLAYHGKIPVEAIHEARDNWTSAAPAFVQAIEQFLSGDRSATASLWIIFHLLGESRENSAYRPLARLLRCPSDDIEEIFAATDCETVHRVMEAVFDGDPKPLYEVILDPKADEYVRGRMLETIAMVTLNGTLAREEASRFLQACYADIIPQDTCVAWDGWQRAVALLGLADLKPLVEQVYDRGFISPGWSEFQDFEKDLQKGMEDPQLLVGAAYGDYDPFGDTIEELSFYADGAPLEDWHGDESLEKYAQEDPFDDDGEPWDEDASDSFPPVTTIVNPYRNIGRNDPCPCGSGKKFKKCCLTPAPDEAAIEDELKAGAPPAAGPAMLLPGKSRR
jgi:hypothetical protein